MTEFLHCDDAIAFEAAAALDVYEAELGCAARTPADAAACARADVAIRRVCGRCIHLPQLSVACVALLLSHYRLLAALAACTGAPPAAPPLLLLQAHQACIAHLQRQCRALFRAAHLH